MTQFHLPDTLHEDFHCVSKQGISLGFEALIYDYTPVPRSLDGDLITPSLLYMDDVPNDMQDLWFEAGYYQLDPVQHHALKTSVPFVWSYQHPEQTNLPEMLQIDPRVQEYMNDNNIACGLTVPIHQPDGGFASLTGMVSGHNRLPELNEVMARFALMAHQFHENIYPKFSPDVRSCRFIELSKREKECLAYSAEGLTAKEIARHIHRSIPTVNMHLNSAIQKLGASNRVQAVVRAMHYRLIE
ncbi:helix-turn-helix transcriptional regulator [Gynuella sunshinyii]|uniref:Response regulator containing a CheY-like receiver domain and an HTH DNA-binding domain n=1 Tax=Gynuella sunshinyii YC6258 TaxID=1445510 RepID=A0A0C5VQE8_9GAMM|nr:LuxR family transcriptional regulator [Gynuella sunshinyii]AJQ96491.1 response regulator containing a CheY-like receiver domain and an HTH DNA-binding domain [Gynuella sunshinyii YC6258]